MDRRTSKFSEYLNKPVTVITNDDTVVSGQLSTVREEGLIIYVGNRSCQSFYFPQVKKPKPESMEIKELIMMGECLYKPSVWLKIGRTIQGLISKIKAA